MLQNVIAFLGKSSTSLSGWGYGGVRSPV